MDNKLFFASEKNVNKLLHKIKVGGQALCVAVELLFEMSTIYMEISWFEFQ